MRYLVFQHANLQLGNQTGNFLFSSEACASKKESIHDDDDDDGEDDDDDDDSDGNLEVP